MEKYVIAIDGPAGTGKSTISKIIANKIGCVYVKTGEMYRAITYKMLKDKIALEDKDAIMSMLENINLKFEYNQSGQLNILDGIDITSYLTTAEVTNFVSQVSSIREIRDKVLVYEKEVAKNNNIIMEGRDIGTTVFPNADVKIYLDASVQERAQRRLKQNIEKGIFITLEEIIQNIEFRDQNDKSKDYGALKTADDAVLIENNDKTIEEVVEEILTIIKQKLGDRI